jgi:hypothetical protein
MNISTSSILLGIFDERSEKIEETIDFVVFVSILSVTTGFGIFYGCFRMQKDSSEEMHFGKRQMKVRFLFFCIHFSKIIVGYFFIC